MKTDKNWNFEYEAPTQIKFGWGILNKIAQYTENHDRVLLICGKRSAEKNGLINRITDLLEGKTVVLFNGISPNPKVTEINKASDLGKKASVTLVIGMGGGSAMDAAKACAVAIGGGQPIEYYLRQDLLAPEDTLPVVAIPTTSGTGSETSMGAIISDVEMTEKKGLRGQAILPKLALVDPELTLSVPLRVSAETGFDIFTHAVETFISNKSSEMTKIYSIKAIEVVLDFLPVLVIDLSNEAARTELSFASMLMGYNLMHAGTCLPHRLQYPLGAHTECSHPGGLAALYPSWCKYTAPHAKEKFDLIAKLFETRGYDVDNKSGALAVSDYVEILISKIGIKTDIQSFGLAEEKLEQLVNEVSGSLAADPGDTSKEGLLKIYKSSWRAK